MTWGRFWGTLSWHCFAFLESATQISLGSPQPVCNVQTWVSWRMWLSSRFCLPICPALNESSAGLQSTCCKLLATQPLVIWDCHWASTASWGVQWLCDCTDPWCGRALRQPLHPSQPSNHRSVPRPTRFHWGPRGYGLHSYSCLRTICGLWPWPAGTIWSIGWGTCREILSPAASCRTCSLIRPESAHNLSYSAPYIR